MMKKTTALLLAALFAAAASFNAAATDILLETESFSDKGGWVIDHEAFNHIQSAYIMAHGIGRPVKDASTTFEAEPGKYTVWVSTYNWTAPWYNGKGPGEFTLKINGRKIGDGLGTTGSKWNWVKAGKVTLRKSNTVTLHDLTGFNGRADAILFTQGDAVPDYASLQRSSATDEVSGYDLVVAGGGISGCATALTAARLGLKVALINNVPWLGGNIMYGAHACGKMFDNLYPGLGYSVCEIIGADVAKKDDPGYYHTSKSGTSYPDTDSKTIPAWEDVEGKIASTPFIDRWNSLSGSERAGATQSELDYVNLEKERIRISYLRERLLREAGVDIFIWKHIYKVEKDGRMIKSVTARDMQGGHDLKISGNLFCDCTGDGDVGYLAGAEYMIGREDKAFAGEKHAPEKKDMKMMGATIYWKAFPRKDSGSFPDVKDLPWAAQCDADYHLPVQNNRWWWETGLEINNAAEPELVRDNYLRCLFGNWAYVKNHVKEFKDFRLDYLNFIAAKRESRRLVGALILNENDIVQKKPYPDASFTTSWTMDLHYAKDDNAARFPGWEWQVYTTNSDKDMWVHRYDVPYRVLCCRDVDNLFIGGRAMSVTHMALGTVRVQCTLGMAGEVTAMAARICKDRKALPLDIYNKYFDELKAYMTRGSSADSLTVPGKRISEGAFGWAICKSLGETGYKLTGGTGGRQITVKSTGKPMDKEIQSAISDYDIVIFDGSNGPFIVSKSLNFSKIKGKTLYGINGAELRTEFRLTDEMRAALDTAGIKKLKNEKGKFFLSNRRKVSEFIEYRTRQTMIDVTGDVKESYKDAGIFYFDACENIIIRNLAFTGPGSADVGGRDLIRTPGGCNHFWIDHCSFADGMKGHINISSGSSFFTISNCTFTHSERSYNHAFSILIGGTYRPEDAGLLNVTLAGCFWGPGCKMRTPMVRSGHVHVYNCYYDTPNANGSVNARDASHMLVENCFWSADSPKCFHAGKAEAYTLRGNHSDKGVKFPKNLGEREESVPYDYSLDDVMSVPGKVLKTAGPTLE